jgi:hypothetical protein
VLWPAVQPADANATPWPGTITTASGSPGCTRSVCQPDPSFFTKLNSSSRS